MDKKKDKDIALFRYGLISPVIHESVDMQIDYFRKLEKRFFEVPFIGRKNYKVCTFKDWLRKYRKYGFNGLLPKTRRDKGVSKKIDTNISNAIIEKLEQVPTLSCSSIYRMLISEGKIEIGSIQEGTVRKYIKDNGLKEVNIKSPRKKFEKEHINELWIGDAMHGPYIATDKKKKQVILIAIIDDMSRVITGSKFFFHENSISLEIVLKEAIRRFGLPKIFYCDNGPLFVSSHLQHACARLNIALVHSKPYDSPSRGKIERFFRSVRQKFLPLINISDIADLHQLNDQFSYWLEKEYHRGFHHGIKEKPMDRFMEELKNVSIKRVSEEELDTAFHITITRKVKNDSTISVNGSLYECPPEHIGKKIEIRYPSDKKESLSIYENDKPAFNLKKVNINENANNQTLGIKFNLEEEQE